MSTIPTSITEEQFERHISPYLSKAKRGFVSSIPLYKIFNYILYWLHTGCQWPQLPMSADPQEPDKPELSYHAVYHHYRKWSKDGSLKQVLQQSIETIKADLKMTELNFDGSHIPAKKGGEAGGLPRAEESENEQHLAAL